MTLRLLFSLLIATFLITSSSDSQAQGHELETGGLSNQEFAATVAKLSEPTGSFDSDNYISNETGYLYILPKLQELKVRGGVYVGVGPEQNFTYIAQIRPEIAFILDIRRDNLLEHLLFKALFEMADSRQSFLSLLLSKPVSSAGALSDSPSVSDLVTYFDAIEADAGLFERSSVQIKELIGTYGVSLSPEDLKTIDSTMGVFRDRHLDLRWEYKTDGSRGVFFPSFREMLLAKDLDGRFGNFLNSDRDFYYIKDMQARNLIIPLTGDFAGESALRNIGEYARGIGETISAFYLSNVEYYLMPDGVMPGFAENVKSLPISDNSILIRAFVNLSAAQHPSRSGTELMTTLMQYVSSFVGLWDEGKYQTYLDVGVADYIDH
ncbi:MAG: hypothetical protein HOH43_23080 [Candidatus Latescibacteria bacterium]|nr:hypothetical protein [Candidatus Latescibacterota bacterium]